MPIVASILLDLYRGLRALHFTLTPLCTTEESVLSKLSCARVLVATLITATTTAAYAIPIVWGGNGHTYDIITGQESTTWDEARVLAEGMGGHLVTITSAGENDFIAALINGQGVGDLQRYWLGGYQKEPRAEPGGSWAWVTGEAWAYTNWEVGEPNNGAGGTQHYLHYWQTPGMWDDMENRAVMDSFVIEFVAVPEPGTLALLGIGFVGMGLARRRKKA